MPLANTSSPVSPTASALTGAIKGGNIGAVKRLLDDGADVNARDDNGFPPLVQAIITFHGMEMIDLLVERKADINITRDNGFTPLMQAAVTHRTELAAYLIDKGADLDLRCKDFLTAHDHATEVGAGEIMALLEGAVETRRLRAKEKVKADAIVAAAVVQHDTTALRQERLRGMHRKLVIRP